MPLGEGAAFAGYTVIRQLGSGAMGEVYLVRAPRLVRYEALKILPLSLAGDADYRGRFDREADAAASLYHPHIVGVHDRGEFDGLLWISMDYVDGADAGVALREHFPIGMPREQAVKIISAVADALDYAHSRGVLHRDVKPANILLAEPTSTGPRRVLLADFGIARQLGETSGLTATNMTVGTVNYAAPEQLQGEPIDGRADQYALAGTAFHLLTGTAPYAHSNPTVVITRHLNSPPPRLADQRAELADLDDALTRAMAKNPAERYASCLDFAAALGGETTASAPTTPSPASLSPTLLAPAVPPPAPGIPSVTPPRSRVGPMVLLVGALAALLAAALAVLGILLFHNGSQQASRSLTTTPPTPTSSTPVRVTVSSTVAVAPPPTATTPHTAPTVLSDADQHGFINLGGARCAGPDIATMLLRTAQSAVAICQDSSGATYYRGLRLADGATLELTDVQTFDNQAVAINPRDHTRYEIDRTGLKIVQNGDVVDSEPAVEFSS